MMTHKELALIPEDFFEDMPLELLPTKLTFAAPLLLKEYLLVQAPELLKEESLHIVVAGASGVDMIGNGEVYYALTHIMEELKDKSVTLHLVGKQLNDGVIPIHCKVAEKSKSPNLKIKRFGGDLSDYLMDVSPHLICLNHPGFESHFDEWFDCGNISDMFSSKVVGCSYSTDEYFIDGLFCSALNVQMKNVQRNTRCLFDEPTPHAWGMTTWKLDAGKYEPNDQLISFAKGVSYRFMSLAMDLGQNFGDECVQIDQRGNVWYWVGNDLFLNTTDAKVYLRRDDVEELYYDEKFILPQSYQDMISSLPYCKSAYCAMLSCYVQSRVGEFDTESDLRDDGSEHSIMDALGALFGNSEFPAHLGERIGGVKGMNQNPELLGTDTEKSIRALELSYNEKEALKDPNNLILALLIEAANVFKDFQGGLRQDVAEDIAKDSVNEYINAAFLMRYGLTPEASDSLAKIYLSVLSIILESGETFNSLEKSKRSDLVGNQDAEVLSQYLLKLSESMIDNVMKVASEKASPSMLSPQGKVISSLIGIESWALKNGVSKEELRLILLSEASNLDQAHDLT